MEGKRRGKAHYPSSSALNYLNANDVRGRERDRERGEGSKKNTPGRRRRGGNGEENADVLAERGRGAVEGG